MKEEYKKILKKLYEEHEILSVQFLNLIRESSGEDVDKIKATYESEIGKQMQEKMNTIKLFKDNIKILGDKKLILKIKKGCRGEKK